MNRRRLGLLICAVLGISACVDADGPAPTARAIPPSNDEFESREEGKNRAAAHLDRGVALYNGGDLDSAIAEHDEAIRIDPQYAEAFSNRGLMYLKKIELDKAIADCTEAIRLDQASVAAFETRGIAFEDKKDFNRSLADFDAAIRLEPKSALLRSRRGSVLARRGDFERAIADMDDAIRLEPEFGEGYFLRASYRWRFQADPDGALSDFDEVIRLDPEFAGAYVPRSLVLLLKERGREAIADCEWVLKRKGSEAEEVAPRAVVTGFFAAHLVDDAPRAKRFLDEARGKLASQWPEPIVRFLRGDLTEEKLFELAIRDGELTRTHCYVGLDKLRRGQKEEARGHFDWIARSGDQWVLEFAFCRDRKD